MPPPRLSPIATLQVNNVTSHSSVNRGQYIVPQSCKTRLVCCMYARMYSLEDEIRQSVLEMGFLLAKISSSSSSMQLGQPQQRAAVQQQADVTLQPLMDFLDGR